MTNIEITDIQFNQIKNFANEVYPTIQSYLSDRNQTNKETVINQIIVGKIGEVGAREWITTWGKPSDVNFSVTKDKSFDPDLTVTVSYKMHVKSQSSEQARRYGTSWTFGYGKNGNRDKEIFDNPHKNDFVIFCLVHGKLVEIKAVMRVPELHKLKLFKLPKKESLKNVKRVIYLNDIPKKYWK